MDEVKFEKKLKGIKAFCIFVGILFSFATIMYLEKNILLSIVSLTMIIYVTLFYKFTKKRKVIGPVMGILLGILYCISTIWMKSIISIIIGVIVLIDSFSMYKIIKNDRG